MEVLVSDESGEKSKTNEQHNSHSDEKESNADEELSASVDSQANNTTEVNVQLDLEMSDVSPTSDLERDEVTSQHSVSQNVEQSAELEQEAVSAENVENLSASKCEDEKVDQPDDDNTSTASDRTPVNADGTPRESDASDEQQQSVSEASQSIVLSKEDANKDVVEKDADDEVDEFFQQPTQPTKKFPGLDNVDLASDDDGQEGGEDDDGQEGGEDGDGEGKEGHSVDGKDETGEDCRVKQDEPCYDSEDEELSKMANSSKSPLKDYPINVGNYKVCRQVEPGVKECIILETGEQIKCFTKPKSPTSLSSSSILQTEPQSTSSPRPDLVGAKIEISPRDSQQQSVTSSMLSENFEIHSFPDGSASTIIAADTNIGADADIGMNGHHHHHHHQQVYITEDGIPVSLDNAEDDVKINIQAEMDRVSKAIQSLQKSGADLVATGGDAEKDKISLVVNKDAEDVVGDVLSSGCDGEGGRSNQKDVNFMQVKKSKRKRDKERYYVLQPDKVSNSDSKSESEGNDVNMNTNNNNNENDNENNGRSSPDSQTEDRQVLEGDVDVGSGGGSIGGCHIDSEDFNNSASNNKAYSSRHGLGDGGVVVDSTRTSRARSPHSHHYHPSSYHDDVPAWSRSRPEDGLSSERFSPSILRGSSLTDANSRYLPSSRSNLYSRYEDPSSSLEASRLSTRYSMLDRGQHNSSPSTGNKQVSWHDMFKMIEEQHRTQQQKQYVEHQRILQEMQESMKQELSKQQDTLKDRLNKYNEVLEELSLGRRNAERDSSPSLSSGQEDNGVYRDSSRTTLDGVPISLRYPPPLVSHDHHRDGGKHLDGFEESLYDRTPVRRCLEKDLSSPPRPADTSLSNSQLSLGEDKQLRGGVYSSPMPLAKAKHKGSPKASKPSSSHHSPREEVAARRTPPQNFSLNAATLTSENSELRQRCQDLDDACHDRKIEIRELTQKIQGLERRAADCTERYETSQSQVVSLHNRLEELTEYAKERDCVAADMEIKAKQSAESLQSANKRGKELTDSLQAAKVTIRKLVEKYEMMEKDYDLLKDSYKDQEESLFSVRKEVREVNSKLARLELDNKQLIHDKEILKHDLTMARSSPTRTNFEEALQSMPVSQRKSPANKQAGPEIKTFDRHYRNSSQERTNRIQDLSPPDSEYGDGQQSPIIKAEKELQKLRESMANGKDFTPKLQRKFYGTDVSRPSSSGGYRGPSVPTTSHHADKLEIPLQAPKSASPRDNKKGIRSHTTGTRRSCPTGNQMTVGLKKDDFKMDDGKRQTLTAKSTVTRNGLTGDQAVVRVKAGEIISRPAWEDMYTSMAPASKTGSSGGGSGSTKKHAGDMTSAMRDMSLKERLQSIENLERKYDDLISDKRKYEAALSRVRPGQTHRREKERLETELDQVDRELGSIRMSLKRYHVLKSSI